MKLLYLCRARIPSRKAHVTHIHKMCDAFLTVGTDLELVHPYRRRRFEPSQPPREYYNLRHRIPTRTLPALDTPILLEKRPQIWFWIHEISYILFALAYIVFHRLARDRRLVVYTRDEALGFVLLLLRPLFSVPLFMDLHDLFNFFLDRRRSVMKRADGLVVNGPGIRDDLLEAGYPSDQILVAPNGIDPEDFELSDSIPELRRELSLPDDEFLVGFTGNPYSYNGIHTILRLARRMPDFTFVTVGGRGDALSELRQYRSDHELENLHIVEHRPHSMIPRYLKSFDCLLLPLTDELKRTVRYATPLKLFEYLAAGKPIVGSDLPSLRAIVRSRTHALLVPPDDVEAFQQSLQRIRDNPSLAQTLGRKARSLSRQFTWEKRARSIVEFIERKRSR